MQRRGGQREKKQNYFFQNDEDRPLPSMINSAMLNRGAGKRNAAFSEMPPHLAADRRGRSLNNQREKKPNPYLRKYRASMPDPSKDIVPNIADYTFIEQINDGDERCTQINKSAEKIRGMILGGVLGNMIGLLTNNIPAKGLREVYPDAFMARGDMRKNYVFNIPEAEDFQIGGYFVGEWSGITNQMIAAMSSIINYAESIGIFFEQEAAGHYIDPDKIVNINADLDFAYTLRSILINGNRHINEEINPFCENYLSGVTYPEQYTFDPVKIAKTKEPCGSFDISRDSSSCIVRAAVLSVINTMHIKDTDLMAVRQSLIPKEFKVPKENCGKILAHLKPHYCKYLNEDFAADDEDDNKFVLIPIAGLSAADFYTCITHTSRTARIDSAFVYLLLNYILYCKPYADADDQMPQHYSTQIEFILKYVSTLYDLTTFEVEKKLQSSALTEEDKEQYIIDNDIGFLEQQESAKKFAESYSKFADHKFRKCVCDPKEVSSSIYEGSAIKCCAISYKTIINVEELIASGRDSEYIFKKLITDAAFIGGDTATNCTIVGMIIGAYVGESGLPIDWLGRIIHKKYIYTLIELYIAAIKFLSTATNEPIADEFERPQF